MMEWRDMESAPKDGSEVLIAVNGRPLISHYRVSEHIVNGKSSSRFEGWFMPFAYSFSDPPEPTHWSPIPDIPAGQ